MASDPSNEDVMKQAQHIWQMLDDLADSDPDGYKKFMDTNMKEGKEKLAPPKPYMCICTDMLSPRKEKLYINITSWHRVPDPKTEHDPIPVAASALVQNQDNKENYSTIIVSFSSAVLDECCKNSREKDMLIILAFEFIEDQRKIKICRKYEVCQDYDYKGDPITLRRAFDRPGKTAEVNKESENLMENPDTLLKHLGISKPEEDLCRAEFDKKIKLNGKTEPKKRLIEELGVVNKCVKPSYEISTKEAVENKPRRVILRILLPEVKSVQECELNISEEDITLDVPDKYQLVLQLPETVNDDEAKAKFSTKSSSLTITMPTKKS